MPESCSIGNPWKSHRWDFARLGFSKWPVQHGAESTPKIFWKFQAFWRRSRAVAWSPQSLRLSRRMQFGDVLAWHGPRSTLETSSGEKIGPISQPGCKCLCNWNSHAVQQTPSTAAWPLPAGNAIFQRVDGSNFHRFRLDLLSSIFGKKKRHWIVMSIDRKLACLACLKRPSKDVVAVVFSKSPNYLRSTSFNHKSQRTLSMTFLSQWCPQHLRVRSVRGRRIPRLPPLDGAAFVQERNVHRCPASRDWADGPRSCSGHGLPEPKKKGHPKKTNPSDTSFRSYSTMG